MWLFPPSFYDFTWGMPRGWFGKSMVNLPSKITKQIDGQTVLITNFRYETDTQGYVTELFSQSEGESETLDFVFTYK